MHLVQPVLQLLAGHIGADQAQQTQVVIRAAGHQVQPTVGKSLRQCFGVVDHPLLVGFEFRLQRLAKAHALAAIMCISGPPWVPGEYGGIQLFDQIGIVAQDQAAPRTAQGLMGSGGHHIGARHRALVQARCHQAGNVGHIHHEHSAVGMGNIRHSLEVNLPRIAEAPATINLGFTLFTCLANAA